MGELELERKLLKESTTLDNADVWSMPYEQSIQIYLKQDEAYKKWRLLKGIREAREKLNDKEDNEKQISKNKNKKPKTKKRIERDKTRIREIEKIQYSTTKYKL